MSHTIGQIERRAADWRQVYDGLRRQIEDGSLAPGKPLPTIAVLADESGLTRHGARRVMERLRDDGWAQSWQGLGYRVAEPRMAYRIDSLARFGANVTRLGRSGRTKVVATRTITLPHDLARDMRLKQGTRVYQAELVRFVDARPAILTRNHFPIDRFNGILEALTSKKSITEALASVGINDYSRKNTRIEARLPSLHEAQLLEIPGSQPVVVTTGVNIDDRGDVVELSYTTWRADCVTFEI